MRCSTKYLRGRISNYNNNNGEQLLVSESYCRIAIVLFIYVSYTNKICLYQQLKPMNHLIHIFQTEINA